MAAPTKESILRSAKRLFKNYVRGCRRKNIFWGLTFELFRVLTSANCTYCFKRPAQKSRDYTYNGIDRANNKQGYTPENAVTACKECNFIKGDRLDFDEMKAVGVALSTHRAKKARG